MFVKQCETSLRVKFFVDSALSYLIINLCLFSLLYMVDWILSTSNRILHKQRFVSDKTSLVASDAFSTCRLHVCTPLFSLNHRKCLLGSTSKRLWDLRPHHLRFCPYRPALSFVASVRSFSSCAYYMYIHESFRTVILCKHNSKHRSTFPHC